MEEQEAQSLSDLVGGGEAYEGDLVKMEDIADELVTVNEFKFLPSTFDEGGEYVCISITRTVKKKEVMAVVNSNAQAILSDFHKIDQGKLPLPTTFWKRPNKSGSGWYWHFR